MIAYTQKCVVAPLDRCTGLRGAENGAELLTCDAHLEGLPNVVFVRKNPWRGVSPRLTF